MPNTLPARCLHRTRARLEEVFPQPHHGQQCQQCVSNSLQVRLKHSQPQGEHQGPAGGQTDQGQVLSSLSAPEERGKAAPPGFAQMPSPKGQAQEAARARCKGPSPSVVSG